MHVIALSQTPLGKLREVEEHLDAPSHTDIPLWLSLPFACAIITCTLSFFFTLIGD